MRQILCLVLVLCAVPVAAQELSRAKYRLLQYADYATPYWWENQRMQDVNAADVICDLPPATVYTVPGFRIADPDRAGRECQWTALQGAEIFLSMRPELPYTFTLRIRPDEWTPWSDVASLITPPIGIGRVTNTRVRP